MNAKLYQIILCIFCCLGIACNETDARPPNYQVTGSGANQNTAGAGGRRQTVVSTDANGGSSTTGAAGAINPAAINVEFSFGYDSPVPQTLPLSATAFGMLNFMIENKSVCTPALIIQASVCQKSPEATWGDVSRISITWNETEILFAETTEDGCWTLLPNGSAFTSLALAKDSFWLNAQFNRSPETDGDPVILKLKSVTFDSLVADEQLTIDFTLDDASTSNQISL